ncbi:MAG: hypothetical protein JJE39_06450 [Vicinamibacteria bacterium]|nr:hypothetical protein [Vicinamibacteria bacterium]
MSIRECAALKPGPWLTTFPSVWFVLSAGLFGTPVVLAAQPEGLTIVFAVTNQGGERAVTHYYTANRARLDLGDTETLVDFGTGRVISISHRKKQYSETTFEEIEEAMTSVSAEMEKAMAGIPRDLRAKMMGDAAREVTVTRGAARTIAGVGCQEFTVALSENTRIDTCAATLVVPPFDPKNFRNLALLTLPVGRGNSGISKLVQKLRDIEGFSLASSTSISLFGRKMDGTTVATEISRGPIDDPTFDLPQGYAQVNSPFAGRPR